MRKSRGNSRDPNETRRRLLKAACQEFGDKGFAGARVDEIADRAGINKQALYYHFGNKDDLFREALESGYRQFRTRDQEIDFNVGPPAKALAKVITVTFDDLFNAPDMIAMIVDENRQKGRHLNRERVHAINAPLIVAIKEILARGEKEGVFRPNIDPCQFYISMMSLSGFYFANIYTLSVSVGRDLKSGAAIRERRANVVDLLLTYVLSR